MKDCFAGATYEQSLPALIERWKQRGARERESERAGNDSETITAAAAEGKHLCDCALTAEDHEGGREKLLPAVGCIFPQNGAGMR